VDDRGAVRFLNYFNFLSLDEIGELAGKAASRAEQREAQKALAYATTALVHGRDEADAAVKASQALFGGSIEGLTEQQLDDIAGDMPSTSMESSRLANGVALVDLLAETSLSPSKAQARKDIESGGVYVNNVREESVRSTVTRESLLFGRFLLLRRGKKNYHMIRATK